MSDQSQLHGVGLALSAGGARGAYHLGCWRAFVERGLNFDGVAGSSIGALNGALVIQGDWDTAYALWQELSRTSALKPDYDKLLKFMGEVAADVALFLMPVPNIRALKYLKYASAALNLLSERGALGKLGRDGLWRLEEFKPQFGRFIKIKQLLAERTPLYITAVKVPGIKDPLNVSHSFKLQDLDEETAWRLLFASMSLPLVFGLVEMDGEHYLDGGITQWMPIGPLYENGFRRIIAVAIKPGDAVDQEDYPDAEILEIKPEKSLGRFPLATLDFSEETLKEWMELGYGDASRALDESSLLLQKWREAP
ncbi:MAG: patatin-like phospholipase family protein [Pseudomonadota bacterium]